MENGYNIGEVITGLRSEYLQIKENLLKIKEQVECYDPRILDFEKLTVRLLSSNEIVFLLPDKRGRLLKVGRLDIEQFYSQQKHFYNVGNYKLNNQIALGFDVNKAKYIMECLDAIKSLSVLNHNISYESDLIGKQKMKMFIGTNGVMTSVSTGKYLDAAVDYIGGTDEIHSISEFGCNHSREIQHVFNIGVPSSIFPKEMQDVIENNHTSVQIKEYVPDVKSDIYCFNEQGNKLTRKR